MSRWALEDAQEALQPLVAAAAARDRCTHAQARQRALRWLGTQLRLDAPPASLGALSPAQLELVVVACTRPLGLRWEPCASCGQPALPSCRLQAQLQLLAPLGAQLASVQCTSCHTGPSR